MESVERTKELLEIAFFYGVVFPSAVAFILAFAVLFAGVVLQVALQCWERLRERGRH